MPRKGSEYIRIKNWEKFQHADATKRGNDPIWIKNYTRLMHDDDYLQLSGHVRAVLHGLWLEYASSGCRLTLDTVSLTRRLNLRVTTQHLETLNHAGFIEFCLDSGVTVSSLEEKRIEEKDQKAFVGELIDRSLRSVS